MTAPAPLFLRLAGYVTPTLNAYTRWHWRKQRAASRPAAWALRLALAGTGHDPTRPFTRCEMRVVRVAPGTAPDPDGLIGGLKPLLDAMQPNAVNRPYGMGLILDDAPSCLVSLTAHARRPNKGELPGMEITLLPIGD